MECLLFSLFFFPHYLLVVYSSFSSFERMGDSTMSLELFFFFAARTCFMGFFPSMFPVVLWDYFGFTHHLLYLLVCVGFFSLSHVTSTCFLYFTCAVVFFVLTYSVYFFFLSYFRKCQLLTLLSEIIPCYQMPTHGPWLHYLSVPMSVFKASLISCLTFFCFLCATGHQFGYLALQWVAIKP